MFLSFVHTLDKTLFGDREKQFSINMGYISFYTIILLVYATLLSLIYLLASSLINLYFDENWKIQLMFGKSDSGFDGFLGDSINQQDKDQNKTLKDYVISDVNVRQEVNRTLATFRSGSCVRLLLTGPPGVGKTFLAECLAGELKVPLIKHSGSFTRFLHGSGSASVENIFNRAKKEPCVILLDEIHLTMNEGVIESNADSSTLGSLLTALVDISKYNCIIIMASNTSRLPPALIRKGRVDHTIELYAPSKKSLLELYLVKFKKNKKDYSTKTTHTLPNAPLKSQLSEKLWTVVKHTVNILWMVLIHIYTAVNSYMNNTKVELPSPLFTNEEVKQEEPPKPESKLIPKIHSNGVEFIHLDKDGKATDAFNIGYQDLMESYDVTTYVDLNSSVTDIMNYFKTSNELTQSELDDKSTKLSCNILSYNPLEKYTSDKSITKLDHLQTSIEASLYGRDTINNHLGEAYLSDKYLTANHELGHWVIANIFRYIVKPIFIVANSREETISRQSNAYLGYVSYNSKYPNGDVNSIIGLYLAVGGSVFESFIQRFDSYGPISDLCYMERVALLILSFQHSRMGEVNLQEMLSIIRHNKEYVLPVFVKKKINELLSICYKEIRAIFIRPAFEEFKKEFNLVLSVKGYLSKREQENYRNKLYEIFKSENMLDSKGFFKVSEYMSLFRIYGKQKFNHLLTNLS